MWRPVRSARGESLLPKQTLTGLWFGHYLLTTQPFEKKKKWMHRMWAVPLCLIAVELWDVLWSLTSSQSSHVLWPCPSETYRTHGSHCYGYCSKVWVKQTNKKGKALQSWLMVSRLFLLSNEAWCHVASASCCNNSEIWAELIPFSIIWRTFEQVKG